MERGFIIDLCVEADISDENNRHPWALNPLKEMESYFLISSLGFMRTEPTG